ncbi:MAG: membrane protein [Acidimicrobiia bacterium]|nr:MAG: membrane protein [Acidimicrobiia bacterium]
MPPGAWRALAVYGVSRLVLLAVTAAAPHVRTPRPSLGELVTRWDAVYYLGIVDRGYPRGDALAPEHAFFPLYPLGVEAIDRVVPGGAVTAGVVLSLVAGAVATVLLWHFAAALTDRATADRTVLVFCFFPGTVVFGWPYADALLLALMCGSLLALAHGRWVAGAAVGALATATRPSGLVLVAACALAAWEHTRGTAGRRLAAAAAAGGICASGFVAFLAWLWNHTGEPRQWMRVEREVFGEGTPWKRLPTTVADTFRDGAQFNRVLVLACAVLALVLLAAGLTARQPPWAKAVTVLALYLALTANIASASPRLQLAAVPAFVALGARLRRDPLVVWCASSGAFAALLVFVYGLTTYVAP